MSKWTRNILLGILLIAGICAAYFCFRGSTVPLDNLLAMGNASDGNTILSWYEGEKTIVAKVGATGKIEQYISFDTIDRDSMYLVRGVAAGDDGLVCVLRSKVSSYDGTREEDQLMVLGFGGARAEIKKVFSLGEEDENYRYGWINVTGSAISLIGTDSYESEAVRRIYEYGELLSGTLNMKSSRTYPIKEEEGIYQAIGNSTDLVYISDSGKIFKSDEKTVTEVYPARELETLMYPTFISYAESGYVYFGEHETGNISKLNLLTGEEEIIQSGNVTFTDGSIYTPKNLVRMAFTGMNSFSAVASDSSSEHYSILTMKDGTVTVFNALRYSGMAMALGFFFRWIVWTLAGFLAFGVLRLFLAGIRSGHTILGRLIYVTIPLIVIVMFLFGLIAFGYYRSAIRENFIKQVQDEGNMLTALFGQESFHEIEYPYDYSGEAYQYLANQMATRDLYTRVIYYENEQLYVGVDANSPCFYPVDILLNQDAKVLYEKAALTGESVTGTIWDQQGERLVCITPVGGLSGQTVYLMETGVFVSNIDSYVNSYVSRFVLICTSFLIITLVVLSLMFYRILYPIGEMEEEMSRFVQGDKNLRLVTSSEDELAGIARIFNKLADDINISLHNMEKMSEIYYRFVPTSMMGLLGKDNLAELTLGTKVEGEFTVLYVEMKSAENPSAELLERQTNRFFETVNHFSEANSVVPIANESKLGSMMLLCEKGEDSAVVTALSILARVDADNTFLSENERLQISFLLHRSRAVFEICGDDTRYFPVLFDPELWQLLEDRTFFMESGSRILATGQVLAGIQRKDSYALRYIGRFTGGGVDTEIYDIYEDRPADEIRLMRQTEHAFSKAMELYEKGFYYEAKNLYAMVLRENQKDLVSRYYVFRCEELSNHKNQ